MNLLKRAIIDEKKAPVEYRHLLRQVKGDKAKRIIRNIIADEKRHLKELKYIRLKGG